MKTRDFHYDLPEELIAQHPDPVRSGSRLLAYSRKTGGIQHLRFNDILGLLDPADILVFNNTRVIPARLHGRKASGGKVEVLIERVKTSHTAIAHLRASKTPKPGSRINLGSAAGDTSEPGTAETEFAIEVTGREGNLFEILSLESPLADIMQQIGHMPLPPYIQREDDDYDAERYQTVYAMEPGAVAAPTAGLHFDEQLLTSIEDKGVRSAYVTLHVGAGTFQPVRSENIEDHRMHHEYIDVPAGTVDACNRAREQGGRIIAVGTTSVRSLESASSNGELKPFTGDSDIFIYPGYEFTSVDAMITNFHLPESSLLMLISAFAGKDQVMNCYHEAITHRYRFFSYGDAMFIE